MCSGCSMAPFAKTAGSSVPASLRPDARPSSARAANNRACSGQNQEQRMSWLCVASTAANDSTRSGNTASINTPDAMTPFLFQLNEESCPAPDGHRRKEQEVAQKTFVPGMRAELFVQPAQCEDHPPEDGRTGMKGNHLPKPGASARRIIEVVSAKPEFVSPHVDQEHGEDAEGVEADLLDANDVLPAVRKRVAPERRPQRGLAVDKSEKAQAKTNVQQNAAASG